MKHVASRRKKDGQRAGEGITARGEIEIGISIGIEMIKNDTLSNIREILAQHEVYWRWDEPQKRESDALNASIEIFVPIAAHAEEVEYAGNCTHEEYLKQVAGMDIKAYETKMREIIGKLWRDERLPEEVRMIKFEPKALHTFN